MNPKMGRPKSDNPKIIDLKVRIDKKTNERLLKFTEKHNTTRAEVIRKGLILMLDSDTN